MTPFGSDLREDPLTGLPELVQFFGWCCRSPSREIEWYHSFPGIAAFVTMYARLYMKFLVATAENVFYQCVDSLIVNDRGYFHLADAGLIDPHATGKLKVQGVAESVTVLSPGVWCMGDKIVDGKLPKKRGVKVGARVRCEKWPSLGEVVRSHELDSVTIRSLWMRSDLLDPMKTSYPMRPCEEDIIVWQENLCHARSVPSAVYFDTTGQSAFGVEGE
jgi:hypothetical protein